MRKLLIAAGVMLTLMLTTVGFKAEAVLTPTDAARAVAHERVYGPRYGHYKQVYPKDLFWKNDGCSVPKAIKKIKGVGKIIANYGKFWEKSCDRHDFGYRNRKIHGIPRKVIDDRFLSNMKYQCDKANAPGSPEWKAEAKCKLAAEGFYRAVRKAGGGSWD